MSKCHYILIDTSKIEKNKVESILKKFYCPYDEEELFYKTVYNNNYVLSCNYEKQSDYKMIEEDSIYFVCKGSVIPNILNRLKEDNNFTNSKELCILLNEQKGNFSFIAMNPTGEYVMATDSSGMEKIYVGYCDSTPVLFTNYNISIYFKDLYPFTSISSIKDGFCRIQTKTSTVYQSYKKETKVVQKGIMEGVEHFQGDSSLDSAFSPLIDSNVPNMFDYETKKGKYGTSIFDRIMCWDDTQSRCSIYPNPPKSINVYEDNNFFVYNVCPKFSTKIEVIKQDWIDQAILLKKDGFNPVLLNMTDRFFPACNIHLGIGGQEETIFRRSNYCKTLTVEMYPFNVDNHVIYSSGVTIFKSSEKDGWNLLDPVEQISLLACPPVKSPYNLVYDYTKLFEYAQLNTDHTVITKKYLEIVFQAAVRLNHDCIVLPAFGCDGHKNPPKHIASIIKELHQKYYGYLKSIFVIMPDIDMSNSEHGDHLSNYRIFKDVIETDAIITNSAVIDSDKLLDDLVEE